MLTDLVVEGLGVIDKAELTLGPGCTALTGETGAGKTLLVAAVGLLLGGKADRSLVRSGAEQATVEARFVVRPGHEVLESLRRRGFADGGARAANEVELVLSRAIAPDGRGRVRIDGRLASVAGMAEACTSLVEIAGQHEHIRLGQPTTQRRLLDAFAGRECVELAAEVDAEVRSFIRAERAVEELAAGARARSRELSTLQQEIEEISAAGVTVGEGERLAQEATRLEHAEEIAAGVASAIDALRAEGHAQELIDDAASHLRRLGSRDPALAGYADRLEAAGYEVEDVAQGLARSLVPPDRDALETVQERLAVLSRLRRKYGEDEAGILAYLENARARLSELQEVDCSGEELTARRARHKARAEAMAHRLSAARAAAGRRLAVEMSSVLDDLALEGAGFEVRLEPRPLHEGGLEQVEFLVAPNRGEAPRPVAKIASGGELARIALALCVLTAAETTETMVFDEVDAGIGGEAAQAVGRCLAQLARRSGGQVLVVTHLPQVAAFADAHYKVVKVTSGGRTSARVERLEGEDRVAELSRMLAGLPASERARGHARELLELAATMVSA
jgi:DNA repair protein RecN (Recombination protein N)